MRVEILGPEGDECGAVECAAGERLLDAFDDARAPLAFGCRSATCGTCAVEVLSGAELLEPPDPIEARALVELATAPAERLACRLVAGAAEGLVRLRASTRPA